MYLNGYDIVNRDMDSLFAFFGLLIRWFRVGAQIFLFFSIAKHI